MEEPNNPFNPIAAKTRLRVNGTLGALRSEIVMRSAIARLTNLLALLAVSQSAIASSLENALDAYVDGLRIGDVRTLNKLFFSDGQFCLNSGAEIECSSFAEALPSWVTSPDPKTRGRIISKEVVGQSMARVTYELYFNGTSYIDYLLLYKKHDQWVVVAKTTFLERDSDRRSGQQ